MRENFTYKILNISIKMNIKKDAKCNLTRTQIMNYASRMAKLHSE